MKKILFASALLLGSATPALAAVDSGKPLLCASTITYDCGGFGPCFEGSAAAIGVPQFFHVDIAAKSITVKRQGGETNTTTIQTIHQADDRVALQGYENSLAWAMEIMHDDGGMVVTAAGDGVGFVIHGACTNL